jgi:Ca-activated chloride channel family protein
MNQLFKEQTRYLLLEIDFPAAGAGNVMPVADVNVSYQDLQTGSRTSLRGGAAVTFTDSPAVVEQMTNRDVMIAVVSQTGADSNELAVALRDEGKIEESRAAFLYNALYLEEAAKRWSDDRLQLDAEANAEASKNLEEEKWNRERKKQQELQLKTRSQRAHATKPKKDN